MSDWVKRITSLLVSTHYDAIAQPRPATDTIKVDMLTKIRPDTQSAEKFSAQSNILQDVLPTKHYNSIIQQRDPVDEIILTNSIQEGSTVDIHGNEPTGKEGSQLQDDDNIKALKKLRSMPRGSESQTDSRVAAIKNLLGEKEIFKTLQMLRWPKGIVCPRCQSSKVVRRDPPSDAPDQRHYYVCLTCKGEGDPSDFDDFTGLPVGTLQGLRQWMLCWYLIGFCSISQIARVLGISVYEVTQIAAYGSQITEISSGSEMKDTLTNKEKMLRDRKKAFQEKSSDVVFKQEEDTRREGLNPFKPGYKSKK